MIRQLFHFSCFASLLTVISLLLIAERCFSQPTESDGVSLRSVDHDLDRCNRTVEIYQAVSSPSVTELNRGKSLHCTYRIRVRPARDDWIVFVRFTKFKVGEPSKDRKSCIGGYIQVFDGYKDSNYTNKDHAGYYCGEIDMPKTFISETPYLKIVFHVDSYDHDTYMQFDANVEQQREVQSRYGQFHQLYPHRRGIPVPGTYCERTFPDCSPGPRCFLQSPGYPGIYSRNLKCRYHLSARQGLVGLELSAFDVDGQACDNLLMCFPRPVTTKENECPYDYVRIYDGPDETSAIIATLCGRGKIKSSIISSGSNMLVEFVTSQAGPLLSTGFHFKGDAIIDTGDAESMQLHNGTCIIERQLNDANVANKFTNIRSWYPANTTCLYKFTTENSKDLISLEFLWFRVERVTLCQENVRLFDGPDADMSTLMTRLCDMNKPQSVGSSKTTFTSTGPALVVQFSSSLGSLDGPSLNYAFDVRLSTSDRLQTNHQLIN